MYDVHIVIFNFLFLERITNQKVCWYRYKYRNINPKNIDYRMEFEKHVIAHHDKKLDWKYKRCWHGWFRRLSPQKNLSGRPELPFAHSVRVLEERRPIQIRWRTRAWWGLWERKTDCCCCFLLQRAYIAWSTTFKNIVQVCHSGCGKRGTVPATFVCLFSTLCQTTVFLFLFCWCLGQCSQFHLLCLSLQMQLPASVYIETTETSFVEKYVFTLAILGITTLLLCSFSAP